MEPHLADRLARRLIIPILLVAASLLASNSAANAGDRSDCPSGYFCVWTQTNYDGTRYQYNNVGAYNLIGADPIGSAQQATAANGPISTRTPEQLDVLVLRTRRLRLGPVRVAHACQLGLSSSYKIANDMEIRRRMGWLSLLSSSDR